MGLIKSAVKAVTSLFSPDTPDIPKPTETPTAPVTDDEAAKRQQQRKTQRKYATSGRAGTVMSEDSNLG